MSTTITLSVAAKAAMATALATLLNGGSAKFKSAGAAVLETITGLTWSASGAVVTSSNPAGSPIDASGTAATVELYDSSNALVATLTVGTSGEAITVDSTTFTLGVTLDLGVITITIQ